MFRDYGELLVEVASSVPDGVVCFFTSYSYMEKVILAWESTGILAQVSLTHHSRAGDDEELQTHSSMQRKRSVFLSRDVGDAPYPAPTNQSMS